MAEEVPVIISWRKPSNSVFVKILPYDNKGPQKIELKGSGYDLEKICTLWVAPGSILSFRYEVDGIDQFDPEQPCKLRIEDTQMYNYVVAPTELDNSMLKMSMEDIEECEKGFFNSDDEEELKGKMAGKTLNSSSKKAKESLNDSNQFPSDHESKSISSNRKKSASVASKHFQYRSFANQITVPTTSKTRHQREAIHITYKSVPTQPLLKKFKKCRQCKLTGLSIDMPANKLSKMGHYQLLQNAITQIKSLPKLSINSAIINSVTNKWMKLQSTTKHSEPKSTSSNNHLFKSIALIGIISTKNKNNTKQLLITEPKYKTTINCLLKSYTKLSQSPLNQMQNVLTEISPNAYIPNQIIVEEESIKLKGEFLELSNQIKAFKRTVMEKDVEIIRLKSQIKEQANLTPAKMQSFHIAETGYEILANNNQRLLAQVNAMHAKFAIIKKLFKRKLRSFIDMYEMIISVKS